MTREIEIPAATLVRCPVTKPQPFLLRRAVQCEHCEHFRGLTEQLSGPGVPFHRAYAVRCAWPQDRELGTLVED